MDIEKRKQALALGGRIGMVFLTAVAAIVVVVYYVLSQNFHKLLSDYSITLVQAMADQGAVMIENKLTLEQEEVAVLAGSFKVPDSPGETITFPKDILEEGRIRIIYVSEDENVSSDGRQRDIRGRQDIVAAWRGETAVYGPYYNEEQEYVVCYSAPIRREDKIVGVLSVEKDGYSYCELIKNIRFVNTGEAYIINAEGTDIAVSDPNHIEWVISGYNSQEMYKTQPTDEVKSILDLELKGLRGERGVGTYYWKDGLVYVIYVPITSVGWVLFAGIREEEIVSMTQSTMFTALSKGPILAGCLFLLLLLAGLIVFWIISSMKKNAEINEKLELIANHDTLTGLLNRRYMETKLSALWKYPVKAPGQAAVFMLDIDDFKKYNDFFGHPKGDDCLRHVAAVFKNAFEGYKSSVMRYGGEEFVAVVFILEQQTALELGQRVCQLMVNEALPNGQSGVVTVSIGICYVNSTLDVSLYECIQMADKALYQAKKEGKNRAVLFNEELEAGNPSIVSV